MSCFAVWDCRCALPLGHAGGPGLGSGAIESGVGEVDVLGVHLLLTQPQALAEALEVDDLPLPQEADDVVHVRVVAEPQDIVVGEAGLLFWCDSVRTTCSLSCRLLLIRAIYTRSSFCWSAGVRVPSGARMRIHPGSRRDSSACVPIPAACSR